MGSFFDDAVCWCFVDAGVCEDEGEFDGKVSAHCAEDELHFDVVRDVNGEDVAVFGSVVTKDRGREAGAGLGVRIFESYPVLGDTCQEGKDAIEMNFYLWL